MIRRLRAGKSPFSADRKHLHHRLLDMGHSHLQAVLIFYAWTAVVSIGCLLFLFVEWWWALAATGLGLIACTILTLAPLSRRKEAEAAVQSASPDETEDALEPLRPAGRRIRGRAGSDAMRRPRPPWSVSANGRLCRDHRATASFAPVLTRALRDGIVFAAIVAIVGGLIGFLVAGVPGLVGGLLGAATSCRVPRSDRRQHADRRPSDPRRHDLARCSSASCWEPGCSS